MDHTLNYLCTMYIVHVCKIWVYYELESKQMFTKITRKRSKIINERSKGYVSLTWAIHMKMLLSPAIFWHKYTVPLFTRLF